jgi:hypothetical protein
MNWNPFKRIAELEREIKGLNLSHNRLIERFGQLEFEVQAQGKDYISKYTSLSIVLTEHDVRLAKLQKQLIAHCWDPAHPDVTITKADVEKEAKARIKRAAYARKYYAKKRAEKAAGDAK